MHRQVKSPSTSRFIQVVFLSCILLLVSRSGFGRTPGNPPQPSRVVPSATPAVQGSIDTLIVQAKGTGTEQQRLEAIQILGEMEPSQNTIAALVAALEDGNAAIRRGALRALGRMGLQAKSAIPQLVRALEDPEPDIRSGAAYTLSAIGSEAKVAVPALIRALDDPRESVRVSAASALGKVGSPEQGIPALMKALRDPAEGVRLSAVSALGGFGAAAKPAVPALIATLNEGNGNLASFAAVALGRIGSAADEAIPALIAALKYPDRDVRLNAAIALGRMGTHAQAAIPTLVTLVQDPDGGVRMGAASALGKIADHLQEDVTKLTHQARQQAQMDLQQAMAALEASGVPRDGEVREAVGRALHALRTEQQAQLLKHYLGWAQKNPAIAGSIGYLLAVLTVWFLLLRLRPLWLLRLNEVLKLSDLTLPLPTGSVTVSLRVLLLIQWFNHHPRVLNAWVTSHLSTVAEGFQKKTTVSDRQVHIPLPVVLDGNPINELTSDKLHSTFAKHRGCLLIWGEGGSGKTSLACQIARWAMTHDRALAGHPLLPVLIEHELNFELADGKKPFIEAIRGQLQALIGQADPISDELLDRLLRQRRILVIVDHFSELGEATRKEIRPGHPDFPASALVITSRNEEFLDGVPRTTLRPLRIESDRISSFMEAYLSHRGKRQIFDDPSYFEICRRLAWMVGQRNITVLLARLYAEQVITNQERKTGDGLPNTVPDLMLNYLNELNRNANATDLSPNQVHHDAEAIAWECLKQTYRPSLIQRDTALQALTGDKGAMRLNHLEKHLRVLQAVGPAQEQLQFALDPLAEYLAGLHLVTLYGSDRLQWRQWLTQADRMPGAPESTRGFLLAVRDCCLARSTLVNLPEFLLQELDRRTGMTGEEGADSKLEHRLHQLIQQLATPGNRDRFIAIQDLGNLGTVANAAVPDLLAVLQDPFWQIRREGLRALGRIAPPPEILLPALEQALNDGDRRVTTEAFLVLGKLGDRAIPTLTRALSHKISHIRSSAAWVLAGVGSGAIVALPELVTLLRDRDWQVQWVAAYALGNFGSLGSPALLALAEATHSPFKLVQQEATRAIGQIQRSHPVQQSH